MSNLKKKIKGNKIYMEGKRGILQVVFGRTMVILLLLILQFGYLFSRMFLLSAYIPAVSDGMYLLSAIMLLFILNTKENPTVKLSWCILVAIAPVLGALLYFYVRYDVGHRIEQKKVLRAIKETREYLPDQKSFITELKSKDPDFAGLAYYLREKGDGSVCKNTDVKYFPLGDVMFESILQELEKAEKFIFMEYFIIGAGHMWNQILQILERKVKEGIEVRVMYDGTVAVTLLPYSYPKELAKHGIACKMFAPLKPFVSTHYNNRDHRKILVIDGKTAFTGGVNISDEYINRVEIYGHWKDTGIMVKGEAARDFTLMFLQMWNANEKEKEYRKYLLDFEAETQNYEGYVIPYCDNPMDEDKVGEMVYMDIIHQAKDYVYIMTPYLILDNEMTEALEFAAKRGIDVRLVLPHIPDKKYAFVLAQSHYKELMDAGVKIYEYTPGFVHAKVFLSDDTKAVVGTINLDYRSLYLHFENAAYLYKVPAIKDIFADFEDTFAKSQLITYNDVKKQKWISKNAAKLLKVIAPLM